MSAMTKEKERREDFEKVLSHNNRTVPCIVRGILENGDFGSLIILADALEEAGYGYGIGEQDVLQALRAWPNTNGRQAVVISLFLMEVGEIFREGATEWLVPMVRGTTIQVIMEAYKEAGIQTYSYYSNLDQEVTVNDRDPTTDGDYVLKVKAEEDSTENQGKSADQLKEEKHQGMILMERLQAGLGHFLNRKRHLSQRTWDLCAGSRDGDGYVPDVYWHSGARKVCVIWWNAGGRSDLFRSRSVSVLPMK